jgi:hypothetical protein
VALDPSTPRSRRAILAAAAGAAAATVVGAVARPSTVRAAGDDGSTVHVGDLYADVRSQTTLGNQANDNIVLWVASNPDSGGGGGTAVVGYSDHGIGVQGQNNTSGPGVRGISSSGSGVLATSTSGAGVSSSSSLGYGVQGTSTSNIGVYGLSGGSYGVLGVSSATNLAAIYGNSASDSTGVYGHSGTTPPAATRAKTGVYGYAAQDNLSRGVIGESPAGIGLYGISSSGYGVYAAGKVYTTKWYEMAEITAPAAPIANRARLFLKDNGLGKTQLCVRFNTGAIHVIATQP